MRRLCFGGSFNPIHHGHLLCARAAAESKGYQQVVLIPSGISPHKLQASGVVTPPQRLEMCRLAVAGDPFFRVEDLEAARPGPSYTIDTARELRRRGWGRVDWLIGADMLPGLMTWHRAAELLDEVTFVVMTRAGHPVEPPTLPGRAGNSVTIHAVEVPLLDISSTLIRRRVAAGLSIRYLTPDAVCEYVAAHGLYL